MFTIIEGGGERPVDARVEDGRVRLSADALREALGWELHDGTLCNDTMCVPLPAGSRLGEAGAAFVGVSAGERAQTLGSLIAPDFTLSDLAGRPHMLSSYRGRKVFMVAWASW